MLVVVWHAAYDLVGATAAAHGLIAAVVATLIMVQAGVLVVLDLRARHRGALGVMEPR